LLHVFCRVRAAEEEYALVFFKPEFVVADVECATLFKEHVDVVAGPVLSDVSFLERHVECITGLK
jgi:hypothetical protein